MRGSFLVRSILTGFIAGILCYAHPIDIKDLEQGNQLQDDVQETLTVDDPVSPLFMKRPIHTFHYLHEQDDIESGNDQSGHARNPWTQEIRLFKNGFQPIKWPECTLDSHPLVFRQVGYDDVKVQVYWDNRHGCFKYLHYQDDATFTSYDFMDASFKYASFIFWSVDIQSCRIEYDQDTNEVLFIHKRTDQTTFTTRAQYNMEDIYVYWSPEDVKLRIERSGNQFKCIYFKQDGTMTVKYVDLYDDVISRLFYDTDVSIEVDVDYKTRIHRYSHHNDQQLIYFTYDAYYPSSQHVLKGVTRYKKPDWDPLYSAPLLNKNKPVSELSQRFTHNHVSSLEVDLGDLADETQVKDSFVFKSIHPVNIPFVNRKESDEEGHSMSVKELLRQQGYYKSKDDTWKDRPGMSVKDVLKGKHDSSTEKDPELEPGSNSVKDLMKEPSHSKPKLPSQLGEIILSKKRKPNVDSESPLNEPDETEDDLQEESLDDSEDIIL